MSYSTANNHQFGEHWQCSSHIRRGGNVLQDPNTSPVSNYTWDAEGRLVTITQGATTYSNRTYDAHGQVVQTVYPIFSNATVIGLFDPSGRELGYYDGLNSSWYDRDIWAAGRMIAQLYPSQTYFLHANPLHSDTMVTNQSGGLTLDMLYYPWGAIWTETGYTATPLLQKVVTNDLHLHITRLDLLTDGRSTERSISSGAANTPSRLEFADTLPGPHCRH